ncbi:tripartite-type tricarboxylate transporter receptor subunit TctC [Cupriavidus gilardii J11]|uniref:Tripartite-type tricarboxylate transporter receptor subunit TctC n=1 Tax=Cupriavidus gilardii J11 TaxID=936133 RepID=A0A562BG58_9BURK|nr:tripartite tricarboxylate transporter substrate binding protein [Cupriavidus gilardii]TWG84073.1 tripartite-type tricarboxylate transporter receptor subunit TctC [Cupriavidus gilardii J11]
MFKMATRPPKGALAPWPARRRALTLAAALLAAIPAARADQPQSAPGTQAYPCPTVRLVSPYPPGGTTDILARIVAPGLSKRLGTTVIVDNRGGASSNIGTEFVARARPDGCTALLGNNTGIVINRNLYKLNIDPVRDLAPVGEVAAVPLVLYVNQSLPAKNVQELVELVKASPGKYSYASGGSGSPQHLAGELIKLERQLDLLHVPYRGQGPALSDVLAGQVPIAFETTTAIAPHLKSGRIRALATTGAQRARSMPDLPTMQELGFPGFVIENWYGVFVPAQTPAPLVERLNAELNRVLKEPDVARKLADMGSADVSGTVKQFRAFIARELPLWESVVKRSGATID